MSDASSHPSQCRASSSWSESGVTTARSMSCRCAGSRRSSASAQLGLARARLRFSPFVVVGRPAEPLAVARVDERTDRELPGLLRARAQAGELPRIHAEGARHLDLPGIETADRLRVPPRRLAVLSRLPRHRPRLARRSQAFKARLGPDLPRESRHEPCQQPASSYGRPPGARHTSPSLRASGTNFNSPASRCQACGCCPSTERGAHGDALRHRVTRVDRLACGRDPRVVPG